MRWIYLAQIDDIGPPKGFQLIKNVANPLIKELDHKLLNEIEGLENPTAENLALWFWNQMKPALPELFQITVMENPTNVVRYRGD